MSALAKASGVLKSVDYEVFGRVQGVCFRMYTEDEARKMGVVGWVKNTRQGTVTGQVQGPEDKVNAMKTAVASTEMTEKGGVVVIDGGGGDVTERDVKGMVGETGESGEEISHKLSEDNMSKRKG
ncbi:hypothetical protein KIL84_016395 [Mauremys mutica]|uniref:Acylphosphatase n=1 Tax=Mauremys mutica TaxID=74926 RepID=A0A9D3X465_9SAUR|nr:hypothetical protein KIL84_016395 [Mauremys mutica]